MPPAEADLHIVQVAIALCDVPDLSVAVTLRERLFYRQRKERNAQNRKEELQKCQFD